MKHATDVKDVSQWFLQCDHVHAEWTDYQTHCIVCFRNLALLGLMSGSTHFNFDASFHFFPKGFKKIVIAMKIDEKVETRAQEMRILMTGEFDINHKSSN